MRTSLDAIRTFCRRLETIERGEVDRERDGVWMSSPDGKPLQPEARARAIAALVRPLRAPERADLLALLHVGGGEAEALNWDEAVRTAARQETAGDGLAAQLMRIPDCDALLEDGLDILGLKPDGRWP